MFLINRHPVPLIRFPAGEVSPDLRGFGFLDKLERDYNTIIWHFESTEEVFILAQIVDAIRGIDRGLFRAGISLFVPYFPFSRQDRRVNTGESNSLRIICDVINSLNFKTVTTYDAHSLMLSAYLNVELNDLKQEHLFANHSLVSLLGDKILLVSPDQGAAKKTIKCAEELKSRLSGDRDIQILQCLKTRDINNGNVSALKIFYEGQDFTDYHIIVVDDICDGGATFISIANELDRLRINGRGRILYTTHGIYSKGQEVLRERYDLIKCAYHFGNRDKSPSE